MKLYTELHKSRHINQILLIPWIAIQGGPKRTERHTSGNKDIKWLVSVDGLSSPEKNDTKISHFVLILEHVMSANVGLQNFPFSGKISPPKNGTIDFFFLALCSDQQLSFFTLLDRTSFLHYYNTKIIKFGWKLFILWVISYRLSFLGFAINLSSCLETLEIGQITKMTVHKKCLIK